ncbi:MAG TPA: hypothetical protein P5526_03810 [Anaerolineae bacterium]|mgnify:CR=1 FL=1|nr:hypothetical protein [Anaerolineales bacterium]HRV91270.1 hypothetical protein [Anaerolineae bacterium]
MNDLSPLFDQIKQLSGDSQAKLAEYVAFLQWQEARLAQPSATGWSFSFIEAFKQASSQATIDPAGMDIKMAPAAVGGQSRPALWAHPPVTGQAVIEYYVPIPEQVSDIRLNLAFGIRDGAQMAEDNLVAFGVKVNGMRVWGQQSNAQTWQEAAIPLTLTAGDVVRFEFTTEALGSHEWTWAVWGNPELTGL